MKAKEKLIQVWKNGVFWGRLPIGDILRKAEEGAITIVSISPNHAMIDVPEVTY